MSGTNLGRMPILIVSLVIGIVMATTAIVPLVSDYAEAKTFTNNGYLNASEIDWTESYIITWDPTDQYKLTINDDVFDLSSAVGSEYSGFTVAFCDNWIIRYNLDKIFVILVDDNSNTVFSLASVANGYTFSATIQEGSLSTTVNSVDKTYTTSGDGLILSNGGDYVLKSASSTAYVLSDSNIYGAGRTNPVYSSLSASALNIVFDSTIDGSTALYAPNTWTVSNITLDKTAVSGYEDLYTISKITATVNDGTNGDTTITYNQIFVPANVTADTDNPAAYKALVKVVPVMAFIALIAAAAYMIYLKRD